MSRSAAGQYLSFKVAGEEYGVAILRTREILAYGTLTRVPKAPRSIRGVLNLRGKVVPAADLAVQFGRGETPITPRTCIVIVEVALGGEETVMGIIVDSVCQVLELCADAIQPPPAFGTQAKLTYLLGMGRVEDRFVLLLDVNRLLSAEELGEVSKLAESGADTPGATRLDVGA